MSITVCTPGRKRELLVPQGDGTVIQLLGVLAAVIGNEDQPLINTAWVTPPPEASAHRRATEHTHRATRQTTRRAYPSYGGLGAITPARHA